MATEIGREGREGKPVGTMFVVGDTKKVMSVARPINFNPFRGYSPAERDVRDRKVREQIKDIAQLEGAIIIRRDGVAEAACMYIDAPAEGYHPQQGPRHPPLVGGGDQQENAGDCRRRQSVVGHRSHLSIRRAGAAHRAAGPAHDLATPGDGDA